MSTESAKNRLVLAALCILVVLHLGLAIAYAAITPYRTPGYLAVFKSVPFQPDPATGQMKLVWQPAPDIGAPDEIAHANYVIQIMAGQGIPAYKIEVPDPSHPGAMIRNPNLATHYEDHQAPLFYILDAWFGRLIGLDATTAADAQLGWRLRILNAVFGAATVLGVYFLAFWGLRRRDVGILAAGITSLLPMNLALSGAVSNDPLLFALCTWTLALCALGIRNGWTTRRIVFLGIIVGLALLTKATALALLPIVLLAFILSRPSMLQGLSTFIIGLGIATPWFLRNAALYGDPLGLKSFQKLFADEITTNQFIAAVSGTPLNHWWNYVGWFTARSFFGVFGYMDIFLNERGVAYTGPENHYGVAAPNTLYRILIALTAVAVLGFFLQMSKKEEKRNIRFHALNAAFLILVVLLFIRYNITFFQGQGRYLYPAIGPIAIGISLGAIYLAKSWKNWVIGAVIALLLLLNAYALMRLPPEFARRVNPYSVNQGVALSHPTLEGAA